VAVRRKWAGPLRGHLGVRLVTDPEAFPTPREASVRTLSHLAVMPMVALAIAASACRNQAPPAVGAADRAGKSTQDPAASEESIALREGLSTIINEETARFRPLDYEYDEDLLKTLDQFEQYLSGKAPGPPPRPMPKLD
jgi:hypothetical protein